METAKRRAPTAKPVTYQGVRYEQVRRPQEHGFKQAGGVVSATDEASKKPLWMVQVYETAFDADEERDAQEVYIAELSVDKKARALLAVDERKRRWSIRLEDGAVTPLPAKK